MEPAERISVSGATDAELRYRTGRSHLIPADLVRILRPDRGAIDLAPIGVSDPDAGIAAAQIVPPDEQVACHLVSHHECRFWAFEHHAARIDLHDIAEHKIKEKAAHATLQLRAAHARAISNRHLT